MMTGEEFGVPHKSEVSWYEPDSVLEVMIVLNEAVAEVSLYRELYIYEQVWVLWLRIWIVQSSRQNSKAKYQWNMLDDCTSLDKGAHSRHTQNTSGSM